MLSAPFLRLSRKDSTKIGFKSKYYVSIRLIKSRDDKLKTKFESENKPLDSYLDHNNHVFDYKLTSEYNINNNNKNSSNYSSSSNNDKFFSVTYSNCPYCVRLQECLVKKQEKNFISLIELKESNYLCSTNCPLQKFSSIRRSNIIRMVHNDDSTSSRMKFASLRKKYKTFKNVKNLSLK